jgi:hypothetical protein
VLGRFVEIVSCDRNGTKVSTTAAVKTGLGRTASKIGNVTGTAVSAWAGSQDRLNEQLLRRLAPASNRMLKTVDRPVVAVAKIAPTLAAVAAAIRFRGYLVTQPGQTPVAAVAVAPRPKGEIWRNRRAIGQTRRVVGTVGMVSALSGSLIARATRSGTDGRVLELKRNGKMQAAVKFQKSATMTRWLNKGDVIGSHLLGKNVVSSEGDIVQQEGSSPAWHRGTTVVKTPQGERTITHLQSLKLPGQHFYFDRKLSDEEVAGLVTGQAKAHQLAGYAGEVHPAESLTPLWGATKKALITNRLYWPTPEAAWSTRVDKQATQQTKQPAAVNMRRVKPAKTPVGVTE